MRTLPLAALACLASTLAMTACQHQPVETTAIATKPVRQATLAYPPTHTVDQVDDYHGTRVADPYRWLEDIDSSATTDWIATCSDSICSIVASGQAGSSAPVT